MLLVGVFFTFLVAGIANPFEPVSPVPEDGPGPNALLQNHLLMVIHPPMLYLGYVGMTVPFGMAAAALLAGRLDAAWVRALRQWMLLPWGCLTVGIILGGWWSYEVLGWGGYWAWDPVENASFLPWLTATAFLHSAMVMERRDHLKGWTLCLVLATFLLTILGTFMTRSGVFNSVHSFTQSPIGPVFLGFLALGTLFSVLLLAARVDKLSAPTEGLAPLSREVAFLLNNLLFVAFTFTVLVGTVYPLLNEAMTGEKLSVGEPYFDRMAAPIGLLIVFLMGIGPSLPWGRCDSTRLIRRLGVPAVVGVIVVLLSVLAGLEGAWALLTFGACGFAGAVTVRELLEPAWQRSRDKGESPLVATLQVARRARQRFGGYIVHLGVILVVVGVAASSSYTQRIDVTLRAGEPEEVLGYTLTYLGSEDLVEPHRHRTEASVAVRLGDEEVGTLVPALNRYRSMAQPLGSPAVRSTMREDLYLQLVQVDTQTETLSLRVLVEPMVWWLWFGGGVMALGTLVAAWPRRRRTGTVNTRPGQPPDAPVGNPDTDRAAS
jgi:cytochrome c-type biogenesis protein CcmF